MSRDLFDWVARYYERLIPPGASQELLAMLQLVDGERVLDLGGGTGRVSQSFSCQCSLLVLDSSWGMLREARDKGLLVCCGLAEELPFPDQSFDRVVMVDVFHHLLDQRRALREALRVLRSPGRLVLEEPDIRYAWVKLIALGERLLRMRSRFYSLPDLTRLLRSEGAGILAVDAGREPIYWVAASKEKRSQGA